MPTNKAAALVPRSTAPASKLPRPLQFPLVVILNLFLSSLLYSLSAEYTAEEFAHVSRSLNDWPEVGVLIAWRTFELGLGWFANFDGYDLAALSVLAHGPPLYLLGSFYAISPTTVLLSLAIDTATTYLPFRLLRPLSHAHAPSTSLKPITFPNKDIITDSTIQALTTILAAGIYSVTLFGAYSSFLPGALVTYFDNIPSIAAAHDATPISLIPLALTLGLAARSFIFTPATTSSPSLAGAKTLSFNPATATLRETLVHNVWDYSPRTKTVIARTITLMLISGMNTFVQVFMTIAGVEARGAVAYSSVWVVAALITGVSLGLVAAV